MTQRLIEDLNLVFVELRKSVNPKVSVVHKDVSYESLSDEKFRAAMAAALSRKGKETLLGELFSEYDAARERPASSKRSDLLDL